MYGGGDRLHNFTPLYHRKVSGTPEIGVFETPLCCRYLIRNPEPFRQPAKIAVTLHGYGSNPESMLALTAGLLGPDWVIASLQAPNQHYSNIAEGTAAYNWGIRDHWQEAVELHHAMILRVLRDLRERFGASPAACLLAGFSQPVGLNYRFAATHADEVGGILGICGGVPRDWEEDKYQPVAAPILHISRDEDEFYPVPVVSEFPRRLRLRASDVEFHLLPGKHRFPSQAGPIVRPWLERVFPRTEFPAISDDGVH